MRHVPTRAQARCARAIDRDWVVTLGHRRYQLDTVRIEHQKHEATFLQYQFGLAMDDFAQVGGAPTECAHQGFRIAARAWICSSMRIRE